MCADGGYTMDRPCPDDHLMIVAKDLTQWETVAYILGLSEAEVEEVDKSYKSDELPLKRIKMLMKWKNKYKENATYHRLITAFSFLERCDMAERVRELSTTPSSEGVHHSSPFAEQLKTWYAYTDPDPDFWPPIDRRKFCKLEIVKLKTAASVNGTIVKKRVPIDLCNIFSSQKELKRKEMIIIEGAPGSGKSTLLWYMCQKWASGEMFQEFGLVIYIKLREYSTAQSPRSVADILPCSSDIKERAWREINEVNGKNVLFLLDGWDELPHNLQNYSIFKDIIKSSPKHSLLHCTVVVTSRYVSSDELHCLATSRLETLGFADQEVKECIMDITGNEEAAHALMEALESRPSLLSSCHLPLNAMIIAYVFQVKMPNLPTTLLETFKLLVLNCIQRHVIKREPDRELEDITSLERLPREIQASFYSLCELAFNSLLEDRMLYTKEELTTIPDTLSLLYGTKLQDETGPRTRYSFLHQTIQELLAAMHMSRMPPDEQLDYFYNFCDQPRFHAMIQFYAGVTLLQLRGTERILYDRIFTNLMTCHDDDLNAALDENPKLNKYLISFFNSFEFSDNLIITSDENEQEPSNETAVLSTSLKGLQSTRVGIEARLMANCLYEAKNPALYDMFKDVFQLYIVNVPLTPSDCLSLGCLIARSNIKHLGLLCCDLSSRCIKSLKQGLSESPCISTLAIVDSSLDEESIKNLSELLSIIKSIKEFGIACCNPKGNGLTCILDALKGCSIQSLTISCSYVQVDNNGSVLRDFIIGMPSLESLNLSVNPLLGDIGARHIGEALKCNNTLRTLDLSYCGITLFGIMTLCEGLETNTALTDLNLSENSISDDGIIGLCQSIALNCTLTNLNIRNCGLTELGIKSLATMLFQNTTIATILWDETIMSQEGVKQYLEELGLLSSSVAAVMFGCAL